MRMQLDKTEVSKAIEYYMRMFHGYTCDLNSLDFHIDDKHDELEVTVEVTKIEE